MKIIKADQDRTIEIPGVAGPVRRPVDIDQSQTGFANLRTLRVYQFDAGVEINGHAEEDEVFVVVLAGTIHLTVTADGSDNNSQPVALSVPKDSSVEPCVAYLPPHSAYKLVPQTGAAVAYARATPVGGRLPSVFKPLADTNAGDINVLLEEMTHAERLRLQLVQIDARECDAVFKPIEQSEVRCEALLHIIIEPAEQAAMIVMNDTSPAAVYSWETVALEPDDRTVMRVAKGASALVLIVCAV